MSTSNLKMGSKIAGLIDSPPIAFRLISILGYNSRMQHEILIKQIPVGTYDNFAYLVGDPVSREAVVIDPAWEVPKIIEEAIALKLNIKAIWLTHGHGDHTEGVTALRERFPVPVYLSPNEHEKYRPEVGTSFLDIGDQLSVGELTCTVLHTPGHSQGGVCFYFAPPLIAGDTLFINGCGRCDLVGSDAEAMYVSLHQTVAALPDETLIYPGHNYGPTPTDTLGNQKKTNRFLLAKTKEDFIKTRMG